MASAVWKFKFTRHRSDPLFPSGSRAQTQDGAWHPFSPSVLREEASAVGWCFCLRPLLVPQLHETKESPQCQRPVTATGLTFHLGVDWCDFLRGKWLFRNPTPAGVLGGWPGVGCRWAGSSPRRPSHGTARNTARQGSNESLMPLLTGFSKPMVLPNSPVGTPPTAPGRREQRSSLGTSPEVPAPGPRPASARGWGAWG